MSTLADYAQKAMELSVIAHNLIGVTESERKQLDGCALDALALAEDLMPKPDADPEDREPPGYMAHIEMVQACGAMRVQQS